MVDNEGEILALAPTGGLVDEIEGDIFDAPEEAVLIHACNCQGSWGKGIAKAFKEKYPAAFEVYRSHCRRLLSSPKYTSIPNSAVMSNESPNTRHTDSRRLRLPEGTTLLIPPQKSDYTLDSQNPIQKPMKHWIACLFTSRHYGRKVSTPNDILVNTELALEDLKIQLSEYAIGDAETTTKDISKCRPGELWSCRFNSGLFAVEWGESLQILRNSGLKVTVVRPEGCE
jgi:ADP-ribose 1''-phosphate phosphatase